MSSFIQASFNHVMCFKIFITLQATMPATEILLPSQPFGNNMEFKHSAQLLAKVCLEMNKALKNGIANAVGDALAELLLKEGLSLRYQQC